MGPQCSEQCGGPGAPLQPVDETFLARLRDEPEWVPRCAGPCGGRCCLRPNVMIFGDDMLVDSRLQEQRQSKAAFQTQVEGATVGYRRGITDNLLVLEIGAGVVVPSIRYSAESAAERGCALVRINPSAAECAETGASERLVVESPWSQFTSECQRFLTPTAPQ